MKSAIKFLVKRAKKTIEGAEALFNEEDYNASVSRAYYAMFYIAEAALHSSNLDFTSHRSVMSAFGKHFVRTKIFPSALGSHLNEVHKLRLKGDYQYELWVSKEDAAQAIAWAKEFVETVNAYLHDNGYLS